MSELDKLTQKIESDETDVRNRQGGHAQLMEDLAKVSSADVSKVFDRVYSDDKASNRQTVIDESQGQLIITDAFKNTEAAKASNSGINENLRELGGMWKEMPWYEKGMAVLTGLEALQTTKDGVVAGAGAGKGALDAMKQIVRQHSG